MHRADTGATQQSDEDSAGINEFMGNNPWDSMDSCGNIFNGVSTGRVPCMFAAVAATVPNVCSVMYMVV
jgi:hypothetical protein